MKSFIKYDNLFSKPVIKYFKIHVYFHLLLPEHITICNNICICIPKQINLLWRNPISKYSTGIDSSWYNLLLKWFSLEENQIFSKHWTEYNQSDWSQTWAFMLSHRLSDNSSFLIVFSANYIDQSIVNFMQLKVC